MTRPSGYSAFITREQALPSASCPSRRVLTTFGGAGYHRPSVADVSIATTSTGFCASSYPSDTPASRKHFPNVACRAVMVSEREAVPPAITTESIATSPGCLGSPYQRAIDKVDVAVIGADVAGLAAALAASRANPGARVTLYDTAVEPPTAGDGGVILSVNGLRALKALDTNLYRRITTELASPVYEALWFDLEGELVRRAPLGQPSAAGPTGSSSGILSSGASLRKVPLGRTNQVPQAKQLAVGNKDPFAEPNPASPPLVVSLHDLREALSEALPDDVQIFGRHYVGSVETCTSGDGEVLLQFAASPEGKTVRTTRSKLLIGADGPNSAVKRLQFDTVPELQSQPASRIVWRGRFTLRQRDPDFARLRNFTTATRTWFDLRAIPGAERTATLSPAGPNTYVWSTSCPRSLLAERGLEETGGASSYWRCMAMFEDFPQDFFAALRATAASAVVEYSTCRPPLAAAASSLAAPWQWFSGASALVGDAVYSLPVDDASSTALNLALEDAAVLGTCMAQHGLTGRALQEYARRRGPRVSAMLAAPPSSPERLRLREAAFLQHSIQPLTSAIGTDDVSLTCTVAAAVDSAAAAAAAVAAPSQPLEEVLAKASAAAASGPPSPESLTPVLLWRPSGGASRITTGVVADADATTATAPILQTPLGPSSPLFSRPSGARRMGPIPAAIAAVMGILSASGSVASRAAAALVPAAAPTKVDGTDAESIVKGGGTLATAAVTHAASGAVATHSSAVADDVMPYAADATPLNVWDSLLRTTESAACATVSRGDSAAPTSTAQWQLSDGSCFINADVAVQRLAAVTPEGADNVLEALPYNEAESPALVWIALLNGAQAEVSSSLRGQATSSAPGNNATTDCTLLPRPLHKRKLGVPTPTPTPTPAPALGASASTSATVACTSTAEQESPLPSRDASDKGALETLALPLAPVTAAAPPPLPRSVAPAAVSRAGQSSPGPQTHRRRRTRGQMAPGVERRGSGGASKATATGHGRSRRSSAHTSTATGKPAITRSITASKAKAKAAATMTISLSAAAALGGVLGAGTGHMPMDVAAALHAHGSVAQFWEDLNNLTLSSASLSSIDLS